MGNVISEKLEYIGRIDDDGYVFDRSGNCMAKINNSGYIGKVGGGEIYGKIDEDGTIRNASGTVIGRIQADGYVYILSNRVCKVSSSFIERITPKAWNAGEASTYSGRGSTSKHSDYSASDSGSMDFLFSPFFIKYGVDPAASLATTAHPLFIASFRTAPQPSCLSEVNK